MKTQADVIKVTWEKAQALVVEVPLLGEERHFIEQVP